VIARARVLTQLRSQVGSAGSLAARVEHDIEMARQPMSDVQAAAAVQALTLDDMTAALAELDLSRAVVLMNGPAAEVKAAFDVLGRRPVYLQSTGTKPGREAAPGPAPAAFAGAEQHVRYADVKASLTAQPPFPERLLMIAPEPPSGSHEWRAAKLRLTPRGARFLESAAAEARAVLASLQPRARAAV
jgi:hypothetical protein